jgi:hypothetical protein
VTLPPNDFDYWESLSGLIFSRKVGSVFSFLHQFPGREGAKDDQGLGLFGRPEIVCFEARRRWNADGGDLPQAGIG